MEYSEDFMPSLVGLEYWQRPDRWGHSDSRWEHDRRRGGHLGREGTAHIGCGVAGRAGGWSEGPNLGFRGGDIPGVWETLATPKTLRI